VCAGQAFGWAARRSRTLRVVFSDILNFVQSMLATRKLASQVDQVSHATDDRFSEANHVVHEGKLKRGCFVRLKAFQANQVKGRGVSPNYLLHPFLTSYRIIIVLDLDVLEELGECEKIGEPKTLS
jgi:replication factor A1